MSLLKKKGAIKRYYVNDHLMDRISGLMFDVMICAGIIAIDIEDVYRNLWMLIAICGIGTVVTFWYVRKATKHAYKNYEIESFMTNFGTLTGTLSTGMILLREIDPDYVTPASSNIVLQNFPEHPLPRAAAADAGLRGREPHEHPHHARRIHAALPRLQHLPLPAQDIQETLRK